MIRHTASKSAGTFTVDELREFFADPQLPGNAKVRITSYSDMREGSSSTISVEWTT